MKVAQLVIDRDGLEEMVREAVNGMFPNMRVSRIIGLSYGDTTIYLERLDAPAPDAPERPEEPAF